MRGLLRHEVAHDLDDLAVLDASAFTGPLPASRAAASISALSVKVTVVYIASLVTVDSVVWMVTPASNTGIGA